MGLWGRANHGIEVYSWGDPSPISDFMVDLEGDSLSPIGLHRDFPWYPPPLTEPTGVQECRGLDAAHLARPREQRNHHGHHGRF